MKNIFTTIFFLFLFTTNLHAADTQRKKIYIAIESGAALGVIPAYLLHKIEEATGKKIVDMVDGLAGISTGGIIATLIANGNYTAGQARDFYYDHAQKIFSSALWGGLSNLVAKTNIWGEVNAAEEFEKVISEKFGDAKLSDTKTYLMVISSADDKLVIFDSDLAKSSKAHNTTQAMVVRATGSLPDIYPKAQVIFDDDKKLECVDAGKFDIHDPTRYLYEKLTDEDYMGEIVIYSLGTGASGISLSTEALINNNNNGKIKVIRLQPDLSKIWGYEKLLSAILFNANADAKRLKELESCAEELTKSDEFAQMLKDFMILSESTTDEKK